MKKYNLVLSTGESQEFSRKDAAVKAGDRSGKSFQVWSPSGKVVAEHLVGTALEDPELSESEPVDLVDDEPQAWAKESRDFPGNYSIVMAPFAETLAQAFGGLETEVHTYPGKLVRTVDVSGETSRVEAFLEFLDTTVEEAFAGLKGWQKENIETRRTQTDMQKYLGHREYLDEFGQMRRRAAAAAGKKVKS